MVKDSYTENFSVLKTCILKTNFLIKVIKQYTNKGKTFHVYGLEGLIFLKCPYYPKQFTGLMQSLSKSQWHF